jgi:adenosylcobinamide kinase / adenosylcobinamide-phosphate guanylyltransferase
MPPADSEPAPPSGTTQPAGALGRLPDEADAARPAGETQPDATDFLVALPLRGRRVVVVGGGPPAARIVTALRAAGALVRVIAPVLIAPLVELADRGLIEVANRQYQARDLADAWLAFACSDYRSVNAALAFDAERARIWCVTPLDAASPLPVEPALRPPGLGGDAEDGVRLGRRSLVLGGARSGKSATAEAMLADCEAVDYIATGHVPGNGDEEWDERVSRHQERRPAHWKTIETLDLAQALAEPRTAAAVLVDCLATWLSQVMDQCGVWAERADADEQLAARLDQLVDAWSTTTRRVVAVSNEVGSGVVPATASGRRFRDELGWLNTRLAAAADEVWLCTAGITTRLK